MDGPLEADWPVCRDLIIPGGVRPLNAQGPASLEQGQGRPKIVPGRPIPVSGMPGPAVRSPEATSRSCRSLRIQRTHSARNDQAATDRPVSLKGPIHKNLSARASRFLRQRFGDPNLALLDPACPPCRWGLRPPAVPSEHMRVRPNPGRRWGRGPIGQVGRPVVRAEEPRPCGPRGKRTPRLPETECDVSI